MNRILRILPWAVLALFATELIVMLTLPGKPGAYQVRDFGRLPVLLNGRVQPFDSVAVNSLLQIRSTGDVPLEEIPSWQFWHHPKKLKATEWLLELMTQPEVADTRPIFLIHLDDLLGEMKLDGKGVAKSGLHYYAFKDLEGFVPMISEHAQKAGQIKGEQQSTFQKQVVKLGNALSLYQRLKVTLQPEGVDNFAQEVADFQKNLGPAREAIKGGSAPDMHQESFMRLAGPMQHLQLMSEFAMPMIIPPTDPKAGFAQCKNAGAALLEGARNNEVSPASIWYAEMATAYRQQKPDAFNRALADYQNWLQQRFPHELFKGRAEFYYNNINVFKSAIRFYLFAFLLAGLALVTITAAAGLSESLRRAAFYLVLLAGVAHTFGLVFRMALEGRPPVTNLYSSAIFIGWGTMVLGTVIERIYRLGLGSAVASVAGFVTLIIANNLAVGGDTMEMMRAVLDNNFWLASHVVVITLGYSAMFFAGVLAVAYILLGLFTPLLSRKPGAVGSATTALGVGLVGGVHAAVAMSKNLASESNLGKALTKMVYGVICFATLFSFIGTVLGGIWADQSWGRFWGWDPKENGALLIVLWNAIILHARWAGMVRDRGLMNLAVFGNIVTSFSWFGVNMLGIGLHSYGFMDAAFKWLMLFMGSQAVIIALGLIPLRLWASFRSPSDATSGGPPPLPAPAPSA
jgi:cytochrome c-type biogenesis protein CcsB